MAAIDSHQDGDCRLAPGAPTIETGGGHRRPPAHPPAVDWLQRQFDEGLGGDPARGDSRPFLRCLPPHVSVAEPLDLFTARLFGGRERRHLAALSFYPSEHRIYEMEYGLHYVDEEEAERLSLFCNQPVRAGYHHPPVELTVASQPWHVYSALTSVGIDLVDGFLAANVSREEADAFLHFCGPLSRPSARALTSLLDTRYRSGPHYGPRAERLREVRRARRVDPETMALRCRLTLTEYLGLETGYRSFEEIVVLMGERHDVWVSPMLDELATLTF